MTKTRIDQPSDRELRATRDFDGPARLVFEAWTRPELMKRWWAPRSMGMELVTCEMDARTGGRYKFEFAVNGEPLGMEFVGRYLEVTPCSRNVWTNEEGEDGAITTVTFEEIAGRTRLVLTERYASKTALEASDGGIEGIPEQWGQLEDLLATLGA